MCVYLKFNTQRLGEAHSSILRGAVVDDPIERCLAQDGGNGDDVALVPHHHVPQEGLCCLCHTEELQSLYVFL